MREYNIGKLSDRQLSIRLYPPSEMTVYRDGQFLLSLSKLLNPLNWWRAAWCRWNWDCRWTWHSGANHRCYCMTGLMFDGRVCLCGFGLNWFYSRFDGAVPCPCDEVVAELYGDEEAE